eukprot:scaffold28_cov312-Pinguiococcus_pyrenoidosus.AAC.1
MSEPALDAALHVVDVLEERKELLGLVLLHLAVLHGDPALQIVQLDRLVGCGPLLVDAALGSEPEVDIVFQLPTVGVDDGVEDDVRVSLVEVPILFLGPLHHLELLDAPHLHSRGVAGTDPRVLRLRRGLSRGLVRVAADVRDVRLRQGRAIGAPCEGLGLVEEKLEHGSAVAAALCVLPTISKACGARTNRLAKMREAQNPQAGSQPDRAIPSSGQSRRHSANTIHCSRRGFSSASIAAARDSACQTRPSKASPWLVDGEVVAVEVDEEEVEDWPADDVQEWLVRMACEGLGKAPPWWLTHAQPDRVGEAAPSVPT